jgi:shikimate dehydrogenase
MRSFGLIGYPLSHSFSKRYFTEKFIKERIDASYDNFPLPRIEELPLLIETHPALEGLNVTIPHKQSVLASLDSMSDVVKKIGACNCIRIRNKKKEGFNTDVFGFETSLNTHLSPVHKKALVLGTGGASKAVCYVLEKKSIPYLQVSRNRNAGVISYQDLSRSLVEEHLLIINTTPLGMYPEIQHCPDLPYEAIGESHYLFDLVYNPSMTLFLQKGRENGAIIENGYAMLELQAEESWRIWNS